MGLLAAIMTTADAAPRAATTLDWVMLGLYLALALGVSFLCSLLEAGLLSLPRSHVELLVQQGKRSGRLLRAMKQNLDRPLAAILTLNTIAHTVGAAGVGAQSLVIFGSWAVAWASAIVTLLILVLSEIIPKSLGAAHTKRLAPFTALATQGLIWVTLPLIIPLQWVSRWLNRGAAHGMITRDEVAMTAELGRMAGELRPEESRVIRNLLGLHRVPVEDVMTPRPVMFTLPQTATVAEVVAEHPRLRFSRMPIHSGDADHITGQVTRHKIMAANNEGRGDATLAELASPLMEVGEQTSVADTLERMVERQQHVFRVVDEFGGTAGLVTQEDCIETLLGVEIVDETDSVEDMRDAARQLLARRRERAQPRPHNPQPPPPPDA